MIIQKYTETMTPRERVRRTFNFETTDRVTIGYGLILLIMPTIAMLAYLVGYKKKPSDAKANLSQKIMYKQKKK